MATRTCRVCESPEELGVEFIDGVCPKCARFPSSFAAKPAQPAKSGVSIGQVGGVLAMALGGYGMYAAMQEQTSVALGPEFGGRAVHNLSLAHQQSTHLGFHGLIFAAGLLIVLFSKRR